jgi:aspartate racemase
MLVALRKKGSKAALVLIHGSDGEISGPWSIAQHIERDRPIYGIRSQAFDRDRSPILSMEDLASHYIREIDEAGIDGSILLLGYSFGGLLAFEIAQQLSSQSKPVAFLGLLDSWLPSYLSPGSLQTSGPPKLIRKGQNLRRHLRNFIAGPDRRRYFRETVTSKLRVKVYQRLIDNGRAIPAWLRDVNDLNLVAGLRYKPRSFAGRIVLFVATHEHRDSRFGRELGWESVGNDIELIPLPGNHRDLVLGNAREVAGIISGKLPDV